MKKILTVLLAMAMLLSCMVVFAGCSDEASNNGESDALTFATVKVGAIYIGGQNDTAGYTFKRIDADGNPITTTPDALYFTLKKAYTDQTALLQKKIGDMTMDSDGTWSFTIQAGETDSLAFGNYVYDIQVNDNDAVTTIAKGAFTLTPEATWQSNE